MDRDNCPICGGKLGPEIMLLNPPNRGRKCKKCGRVDETPKHKYIRHSKNGYKWSEV